jgi:hypothetical protein
MGERFLVCRRAEKKPTEESGTVVSGPRAKNAKGDETDHQMIASLGRVVMLSWKPGDHSICVYAKPVDIWKSAAAWIFLFKSLEKKSSHIYNMDEQSSELKQIQTYSNPAGIVA